MSWSTTFSGSLHIKAGELNGDDFVDLVVTATHGEIAILPNNGNGQFPTSTLFAAPASTFKVAIGDIDADGNQDLAVASRDQITVYKNDGSASFTSCFEYPSLLGLDATFLDLDNDSDLDLISTNFGEVRIFQNDGSGRFALDSAELIDGYCASFAVADLNHDNIQDVIIGLVNNSVVVAKGNVDGSLGNRQCFASGTVNQSMIVADFDGDSDLDLVSSGTLSPFFGNGRRAVLLRNLELRIGDVNGDGSIDLLDVAAFVEALQSGVYLPEAADINQDGVVDLLDVEPFVQLLQN